MTEQDKTILSRRAFLLACLGVPITLAACSKSPEPIVPTPTSPPPEPTKEEPLTTEAPPTLRPIPRTLVYEQDDPEIVPTIPRPATAEALSTPTPDLLPLFTTYSELLRNEVEAHQGNQLRLCLIPLASPDFSLDFGSEDITPSASALKPLILLYALLRRPDLAITPPQATTPASDAYRMIVSSNNSATARVLASSASSPEQALNEFNLFLHHALRIKNNLGLTRWGYYPTAGSRTDQVTELSPYPYDYLRPEGFANPFNLRSLTDFYELLENPDRFIQVANFCDRVLNFRNQDYYPTSEDYLIRALQNLDRIKALLAIPDPQYQTQLDLALTRAKQRYPDLDFTAYGKNGSISPDDWEFPYWFINEAAVVNVGNGHHQTSFILAHSAHSFSTDALLDLSLDYFAAVLNATTPNS